MGNGAAILWKRIMESYEITFAIILILVLLLVSVITFGITYVLRRKKVLKFIPAIFQTLISLYFALNFWVGSHQSIPINSGFGLWGATHAVALAILLYLTGVCLIAALSSIIFLIFYGLNKNRKKKLTSQ
ncbi:MAG TPA: hypothetical protein VHT96_01575 [Clostridia bacterium]|nr:hypothetical protein [Clostridia bacterium]